MSCWWDDHAKRYRSSLPWKVFYVWGWPLLSWVMVHTMSPERAHWFAIHIGIPAVGFIDRIWTAGKVVLVVLWVVTLRLLAFLPGCCWEDDREKHEQGTNSPRFPTGS